MGSTERPYVNRNAKGKYSRGKEVFVFEYDKFWLKSDFVQALDPELQLYPGPQYLGAEEKPILVCFWILLLTGGEGYLWDDGKRLCPGRRKELKTAF